MNKNPFEAAGESDLPPFVFKMPFAGTHESESVDLKWLAEQQQEIDALQERFSERYQELLKRGRLPSELLRAQLNLIAALGEYQVTLRELQNRRQGTIENESEMQELMTQFESFMKNMRGGASS